MDFLNSSTKRDLAKALNVKYNTLIYNLYRVQESEKYTSFSIPKKGGGNREIVAPISGIKNIQRKLASILIELYPDKNCVYGFMKNKNILHNAKQHTKKRLVINIDLRDFFPSINFGRVLGLFKSYPFNFNDEVAVTLAQISCHDNALPQGAPSSPIISNFICRRLDNALLKFARQNRFTFSRYADDITFSTNLKELPIAFGVIENDRLVLSTEFISLIKSNGFQINDNKTRYAYKNNRQTVTGLTVNEFPNVNRKYVRNIRAMIHAWNKHGIEKAATEYFEKYKKIDKPEKHIDVYRRVVIGKINFLRYIKHNEKEGDCNLYKKFTDQVKELYPEAKLASFRNYTESANTTVVFGEGETDSIHLEAAFNFFQEKREFLDLFLKFSKESPTLKSNNTSLMNFCVNAGKYQYRYPHKIICLFDRDDRGINSKHNNGNHIPWGNNVYSTLMPKPDHRNFDEVCIEFYYTDEDLKTKDENGRRIFTSDEFDKNTGYHKLDPDIYHKNNNYLKAPYPRVLDSNVYKKNKDGTESSIALNKKSFARNCEKRNGNFKDISFEYFRPIFEYLSMIINDSF